MPLDHLSFDGNLQHGRILRTAMTELEIGLDQLNDCVAVMGHMITGDGSTETQFTYLRNKFGFPDDATAKAAYQELQSLAFKLNSNGNITDMNAALIQAFNKFR